METGSNNPLSIIDPSLEQLNDVGSSTTPTTYNQLIIVDDTLEVSGDIINIEGPGGNCSIDDTVPTPATGIHNLLNGLQGGNSTQRYHLSKTVYDALIAGSPTPQNRVATLQDIVAIFPDGVITGLGLSTAGQQLTIQSGTWRIDNIVYHSTAPHQFTLPVNDPVLFRYDVVYAQDEDEGLGYISGTFSATPVEPNIPEGSIRVGAVFITPDGYELEQPDLSSYVDKITNQSINGIKTFLQSPIVPNATTNKQAVNFEQLSSLLPSGLTNQQLFVTQDSSNKYKVGDEVAKGQFITNDEELDRALTRGSEAQIDIFNNWKRFAHNGIGIPVVSEINYWIYSSVSNAVQLNLNTNAATGVISPDLYGDYVLSCTLSSNVPTDNDWANIVIAYVEDPDIQVPNLAYGLNQDDFNWKIDVTSPTIPEQYTISLLRARNVTTGTLQYSIVYNRGRGVSSTNPVKEKVLAEGSLLVNHDNINDWGTETVDVKVQKVGDIITVWTTEFSGTPGGKGALRFPLTVDMSTDPLLARFRNGASYGFGGQSQRGATFSNIVFSADQNVIYDLRDGTTYVFNGTGYTVDPTRDFFNEIGVERILYNHFEDKLLLVERNHTIRTLAEKVDLSVLTFTNGLTRTGDNIKLGGTLAGDTLISGPGTATYKVQLASNTAGTIGQQLNTGASSIFAMNSPTQTYVNFSTPTNVGFGRSATFTGASVTQTFSGIYVDSANIVVKDNQGLKGLINDGDYEANFVARSLITKQWISANVVDKSSGQDDIYGTKVFQGDIGFTSSIYYNNPIDIDLVGGAPYTRILAAHNTTGRIGYYDISKFALDTNVVHKTGNETINGAKRFTSNTTFDIDVTVGSSLYWPGVTTSPAYITYNPSYTNVVLSSGPTAGRLGSVSIANLFNQALINPTAATVSVSQSSPTMIMGSSVWDTTTGASVPLQYRVGVEPIGNLQTTGALAWYRSKNNGSTWAQVMRMDEATFNVTGSIGSSASITASQTVQGARNISTVTSIAPYLRLATTEVNNTSPMLITSLLDATSQTKGILIPRMFTAQRDAITGGFSPQSIDITNQGSGYTTATVVFSGGSPTTAATAVARIVSGKIAFIDITNQGIGYTSLPTVTITGDGTGATAIVSATPTGLAIYNLTSNTIDLYYSGAWHSVGSGGGSGTVTSITSANSDISVATGTTTPVLTLNNVNGITKSYYDVTSSIQTQLNNRGALSANNVWTGARNDFDWLNIQRLNAVDYVQAKYITVANDFSPSISVGPQPVASAGGATTNIVDIQPVFDLSGTYNGIMRGIYYHPSILSMTGTNIAFESTTGEVRIADIPVYNSGAYKNAVFNSSTNRLEYLGNVVSASSTLTLTGGTTTFTGTIATYTLPSLSGNTGITITIINAGSGIITLNSNAGGNDIWNTGVDESTHAITAGSVLTLYNNSLRYVIINN